MGTKKLVEAGGVGPGRGAGDGGGRGCGVFREGGGRYGESSRELKWEDYIAYKYNIGTESSVPVASVMILVQHHPTTSTLWGHGGRSKMKKIKISSM